MLDLIQNYELSRSQLQQRICELNALLKNPSLQTIEREKLTLRRDMLYTERRELVEDILQMKQHLGKEERSYVRYETSL